MSKVYYEIKIEKDEVYPEKYKIIILNEENVLIGVPARGITKQQALLIEDNIRYAFQYGLDEGISASVKQINKILY